jgi:hypothetical protein
MCEQVATGLRPVNWNGVKITMVEAPWINVLITFPDRAYAARTVRALEAGRPRVFVAANRISNAEIAIMPHNLTEQDVPDLIGRLREAITASAA